MVKVAFLLVIINTNESSLLKVDKMWITTERRKIKIIAQLESEDVFGWFGHSKNVPCSKPLCGAFVFSRCLYGFSVVSQLPPICQRRAFKLNGDCFCDWWPARGVPLDNLQPNHDPELKTWWKTIDFACCWNAYNVYTYTYLWKRCVTENQSRKGLQNLKQIRKHRTKWSGWYCQFLLQRAPAREKSA